MTESLTSSPGFSTAPIWLPLDREADPDTVAAACREKAGAEPNEIIDTRKEWENELAALPAELGWNPSPGGWQWVFLPWTRAAFPVPPAAAVQAVLASRNYPVISLAERRVLSTFGVVIAGLSTGRAVAQQLARLGIQRFVLADADVIAPSNLNRMVGTGLHEVGLPKVVSVARELAEFNPYVEVLLHQGFVTEESLDAVLARERIGVVVETVDQMSAKVGIRRAARSRGVPVVMVTDFDWQPMVDLEPPDGLFFNGRLTLEEVASLESSSTDMGTKTRLAMKVMAIDQWPPRSLLGGRLAESGLTHHWPQIAPSAMAAGALAARAILGIARRDRWSGRAVASLSEPFGPFDAVADDTLSAAVAAPSPPAG